jgi:N-acetylglucosamine kinase-like BadF-type ATPase
MHYKIGLYGDDNQTDFILVNPAGGICARRTAIGVNPDTLLDQDTIRSLLIAKLEELAAHAKAEQNAAIIAHTALCLPGSLSFWEGIVARLHNFSPASAHPNYVPALEQATRGLPGILLNCDPLRALVAGRAKDDQIHCAGNLGCRMSDPGSDYDLGRQALTCTLAELQGWGEQSELGKLVCAAMKVSDATLLSTKLDGTTVSHQQIADLAAHVLKLEDEDDDIAMAIIHDTVCELAYLAETVREKLFEKQDTPPIGLRGAILQTDIARQALTEIFGPDSNFIPITDTPTEGLRLMLNRLNP